MHLKLPKSRYSPLKFSEIQWRIVEKVAVQKVILTILRDFEGGSPGILRIASNRFEPIRTLSFT
jgi:hypothetical protein